MDDAPLFENDCRDAVQNLRGALLDLYVAVGADPARPQDVARRFHLNKNLTWKIAKIIQAEDALQAAPLVPGTSGMDILMKAMAEAAPNDDLIRQTRVALERFERVIELHCGDRATLEMALDGGDARQLEKSRKLAFRGNCGLWGLQASARVTAQFIAPSAEDETMLDVAQLTGLEHVRRYRHTKPWPVFRFGRYIDQPSDGDSGPTSGDPQVIHQWSRSLMPEIDRTESRHEVAFELGSGPLGRLGECTLYCGVLHRRDVPRYATATDETGSLFTAVNLPVETMHFDLFVHRDLTEALGAEASIYGSLWSDTGTLREAARLPVSERVVNLGRGANVSTPIADAYGSLVQRMFDDASWDANDFHCLRFVVQYPPMPSTAMLRFPLPSRD